MKQLLIVLVITGLFAFSAAAQTTNASTNTPPCHAKVSDNWVPTYKEIHLGEYFMVCMPKSRSDNGKVRIYHSVNVELVSVQIVYGRDQIIASRHKSSVVVTARHKKTGDSETFTIYQYDENYLIQWCPLEPSEMIREGGKISTAN